MEFEKAQAPMAQEAVSRIKDRLSDALDIAHAIHNRTGAARFVAQEVTASSANTPMPIDLLGYLSGLESTVSDVRRLLDEISKVV